MSGRFTHQALVYSGVGEFLEHTVPFVEDGLAAGDRVLAVTTRANAAALQGALDGRAADVDFRAAEEWYESPSRTLVAYAQYVDRHGPETRVRVIGEPVWQGRSEAAVREWTRYESILNAAFADANAWILCPYDASALDERIVAGARSTHPEVCAHGEVSASGDFVDPRELSARLDADDLEEPPPGAVVLSLRSGLHALRTFAREHARAAGIDEGSLARVELAVHEALANAVVHGRGSGSLGAWNLPGGVVYEVSDEGDGFRDALAGHLPPDSETPGGFGLWVARQLADLVEVRSRNGGTRVRLHFAHPARR